MTSAGVRHVLPDPFFVLATQNPIEQEGTYPLPEAQLDRFLAKIEVRAPGERELVAILDATTGAARATPRRAMNSSNPCRTPALTMRRSAGMFELQAILIPAGKLCFLQAS